MNEDTKQNLDTGRYIQIIDYLNQLDYERFNNHPMAWFIRKATLKARDKVLINAMGVRNFKCYAPNKMVVVDNMGNVLPCEMIKYSYGNLRDCDYNIRNILPKKLECSIPCTWECAIRTSIIYNPKEWIKLFFKA